MNARLIAAAGLALSLPVLLGWTDSWDSIRRVMSDVRTIQASFIQKKNLKILAKPLVSRGTFSYKAPGHLRWEYASPIRNIMQVTPDAVRRFTWKDGKFVTDASARMDAVRIVMDQIAGWLHGQFEENDTFTARLDAGASRIDLVPKKTELTAFITRVRLSLSGTPGVISRVEILEPQGSSTVLEFTDVAVNGDLDPAVFTAAP